MKAFPGELGVLGMGKWKGVTERVGNSSHLKASLLRREPHETPDEATEETGALSFDLSGRVEII